MSKPQDVVSVYKGFHNAHPIKVRRVKLPEPTGKKLIKIGRLTSICYEPEDPSMLKGTIFEHTFGDVGTATFRKEKPILVTDGKNLFIIREKSKYKFSKRGIIG